MEVNQMHEILQHYSEIFQFDFSSSISTNYRDDETNTLPTIEKKNQKFQTILPIE